MEKEPLYKTGDTIFWRRQYLRGEIDYNGTVTAVNVYDDPHEVIYQVWEQYWLRSSEVNEIWTHKFLGITLKPDTE